MRKIFVVLAGLLCACNSNNDKKAAPREHPLTGRWQLDSIDLSNKVDTELSAIAAYLTDEDRYKHVQFGFSEKGMLTEYGEDGAGMTTHFELRGDSLKLTDEDVQDVFIVKKLNASDLVLITSDTVQLFFKRTK